MVDGFFGVEIILVDVVVNIVDEFLDLFSKLGIMEEMLNRFDLYDGIEMFLVWWVVAGGLMIFLDCDCKWLDKIIILLRVNGFFFVNGWISWNWLGFLIKIRFILDEVLTVVFFNELDAV